MILGITSIVFCWLGVFTLAQVVLAITFGSIGIRKGNQGAAHKGMAVAGLCCGIVGAVLYVIFGAATRGIGFLIRHEEVDYWLRWACRSRHYPYWLQYDRQKFFAYKFPFGNGLTVVSTVTVSFASSYTSPNTGRPHPDAAAEERSRRSLPVPEHGGLFATGSH
jgi:hypothetical protein